jgi:hypothetical protein
MQAMLIEVLPCVDVFVDKLNEALKQVDNQAQLTRTQRLWFMLVLTGILVTDQLCWAMFERRGLNRFTQEQLRWVFNHARIAWSSVLRCSVRLVFAHYGIAEGVLVIDDTDKKRAKVTEKIAWTHKIKDKKSGGYINGQEIVFLFLVTPVVSIPIDFRFYMPDPELSLWRKRYREQRKNGIARKDREARPKTRGQYPSKSDLALQMLSAFTKDFPKITLRAVLADALYGCSSFMKQAQEICGTAQIVSELRSNQLVQSKGRYVSLKTYFARQRGVNTHLRVRGQADQPVVMLAARLIVKAHGKRRFVIALRYQGEEQYRFLVASNLSWRHTDVAQLYTLRWLIEVFFEDWKAHGGWHQLTKHQGADGSTRGVILSLLCDHLVLLHPDQSARLKNKQPALSVGCLIEHIKMQALIVTVEHVVCANDPIMAFESFSTALQETLVKRSSKKHMAPNNLGNQKPVASLKYKSAA